MGEDGVAESGVREVREHGGLHDGHDFASFRREHGEAEDAIAGGIDKGLEEAMGFVEGTGAKNCGGGDFGQAIGGFAAGGLGFRQADVSERRIDIEAGRDQAVSRGALTAGEVVADDAEVIKGDVGELGGASAFAEGEDAGGGGFEAFIDFDVAAGVKFDAGQIKANVGGVGGTAGGDEEVGALDGGRAGGGFKVDGDGGAGEALDGLDFGGGDDSDPFGGEDAGDFGDDVGVLVGEET